MFPQPRLTEEVISAAEWLKKIIAEYIKKLNSTEDEVSKWKIFCLIGAVVFLGFFWYHVFEYKKRSWKQAYANRAENENIA